jgi:hypothetical protein
VGVHGCSNPDSSCAYGPLGCARVSRVITHGGGTTLLACPKTSGKVETWRPLVIDGDRTVRSYIIGGVPSPRRRTIYVRVSRDGFWCSATLPPERRAIFDLS